MKNVNVAFKTYTQSFKLTDAASGQRMDWMDKIEGLSLNFTSETTQTLVRYEANKAKYS